MASHIRGDKMKANYIDVLFCIAIVVIAWMWML